MKALISILIIFCFFNSYSQTLLGTLSNGRHFSIHLDSLEKVLSEKEYQDLMINSMGIKSELYHNKIQVSYGSFIKNCDACELLKIEGISQPTYFLEEETPEKSSAVVRINLKDSLINIYKYYGRLLLNNNLSEVYNYVKPEGKNQGSCSFMGLSDPECGYQLPVGIVNNRELVVTKNNTGLLWKIKHSNVSLIDYRTLNEDIICKDCFNPSISPDENFILVELSKTQGRKFKIYDVKKRTWRDDFYSALELSWLYK